MIPAMVVNSGNCWRMMLTYFNIDICFFVFTFLVSFLIFLVARLHRFTSIDQSDIEGEVVGEDSKSPPSSSILSPKCGFLSFLARIFFATGHIKRNEVCMLVVKASENVDELVHFLSFRSNMSSNVQWLTISVKTDTTK